MAISGRKVLDLPPGSSKVPWGTDTVSPAHTVLTEFWGGTLLSLVLRHLEVLPVLSWDPTSPSFGGISPFLLREQVVTPCLRNWCRSQLDLVEKKASHF